MARYVDPYGNSTNVKPKHGDVIGRYVYDGNDGWLELKNPTKWENPSQAKYFDIGGQKYYFDRETSTWIPIIRKYHSPLGGPAINLSNRNYNWGTWSERDDTLNEKRLRERQFGEIPKVGHYAGKSDSQAINLAEMMAEESMRAIENHSKQFQERLYNDTWLYDLSSKKEDWSVQISRENYDQFKEEATQLSKDSVDALIMASDKAMPLKSRLEVAAAGLDKALKNTFKTIEQMENRKITGYRLKDEKYRKSVIALMNSYGHRFEPRLEEKGELQYCHVSIRNLREAGVLDLWFNPVYENVGLSKDHTGWVTHSSRDNWLVYYENGKAKYGFAEGDGRWMVFNGTADIDTKCEKASDARVEAALTKEALRRGYTDLQYECLLGRTLAISGDKFKYLQGDNTLKHVDPNRNLHNNVIFHKGEWAEAVKMKLPNIAGYEANLEDEDYIQYGCHVASKKTLRKMRKMGITAIHLEHEGKKIFITEKDTKKIFDYVQNEYNNGK